MRGKDLCFRDQFVDAHHDGGATDGGSAAAVGVPSIMGDCSVAPHDDNILDRDSEFITGDLRKAGLLPLAMGRGASDDGYLSGYLNAHAAPFPAARGHHLRGTESADFDVGREAD